jgi:hypothetical protein
MAIALEGERVEQASISAALEAMNLSTNPTRVAVALEAILAKLTAVEGTTYIEVSKDIGVGHEDITLTPSELKATVVKLIGIGDAGFNLILDAGVKKLYLVDNQSGQDVTVKLAASAGTAIVTTKRSWLWSNGTDVVPAVVA